MAMASRPRNNKNHGTCITIIYIKMDLQPGLKRGPVQTIN